MASDITAEPGPTSVLSRIKALESQSLADSSSNQKRSNLIIDSDGDHEEDWVSVPITATALTPTIITTSVAPPLPSRKQNHVPALSVSSFHSVSLSSESVNSLVIDSGRDFNKEEDTVSLESEPYEDVDSTTSLGSPGAVARLTADWNQLNNLPSNLQRPRSAAPIIAGKTKSAPPLPPPRSASASFSSSVSSSGPPSASTSNGRRPPPPPPSSNRASTFTTASSDRSSVLDVTSNASSTTSSSINHGYPPYQAYKSKPPPPPPPNKPTAPLKPQALKYLPSSSSSSSVTSSSSTSTTGPGPSTSSLALARPTPVPPLARKRYETVFEANLANLNIAASNGPLTSTSSKPALLSPSAALAISRKGWRGLSIDLVTSDEKDDRVPNKDKDKDNGHGAAENGQTKFNRLPGPVVRVIWEKSRLSREKLSAIWLECDLSHTGSLDRDTFVKGMWRIDAELRREELERTGRAKRTGSLKSVGSIQRQSSTASTTSSSHSLRSVPSVGSLRRKPVPAISMPMSPIPPIPSPASSVGTSGTLTTALIPPPLPARKPTMGTGLGSGTGSKVDLGDDAVDLLL
ncbi:hypothetical protein C8J55DRAFT_564619 [Lentinula edodes]|uniref:EH domain-containing protein n=1 Tax=Lentinula lateritia TaxID=40482 RepID=A0A9W8ZXV8_9AGAR|nr:hypothetical protein C8J55DRAFT_564619 [Lentinula edodes]